MTDNAKGVEYARWAGGDGVVYYWEESENKHYVVDYVAWGRDENRAEPLWYWTLWNEEEGALGKEKYSTSAATAKREADQYAAAIGTEVWECDEFGIKAQ